MGNISVLSIIKFLVITAILVAIPVTIMLPEKDLTFLIKVFEKFN